MTTPPRLLLVVGGTGVLALVCFAAALLVSRAAPDHDLVHSQGIARLIVTAETIAADDRKLLEIADVYLRRTRGRVGQRAVILQVWTDRSQVPTRLEDMTDLQADARRAVVWINEATSLRKVER